MTAVPPLSDSHSSSVALPPADPVDRSAPDRPLAGQRPNILFLVLDTQRVDRLSCYGYTKPTSPNLDRFAQGATRFNRAIAAAQWTIPSHASMFTGRYPSEHQVLQSYSVLPPEQTTLAERLQAGGYFTAGFCNNPLVGIINNGLRRGFDSFLNYSGLLTDRPNQAGRNPGLMGRYRQFFKRCLATLLGRVQDAFARSELLLSLSFTPLMVPLWQTAISFKGNTAKSLSDAARLLIDRQIDRQTLPPDQPVFAFINLMGVHMPYHPPRSYVARFAPHVLEDPAAQRYLRNFNSDVYGWLAPLAGALDEPQKATLDGMYDAEVAHQDEQLGIFFRKLEESGVLEHTLVIICSDHGEHLGEKQFIGHSLSVYNELVQVPLIIRDPQGGLEPGAVVNETVSTRRLFHTVLSAAQIARPEEAALSLCPSAVPIAASAAAVTGSATEVVTEATTGAVTGTVTDATTGAVTEATIAATIETATEIPVAHSVPSATPGNAAPAVPSANAGHSGSSSPSGHPAPPIAPVFDPVFSEAVPPQNVINLLRKRQPQLIHDRACDQPRRAVWAGPHKLIETGRSEANVQALELYDVTQDPTESLNLRDILPENVEVLQDCLLAFGDRYGAASGTALESASTVRAPGFDDPEVQQRLRDLGYLEE